MRFDDSSSSFVFPVGEISSTAVPSIGTSYNPVDATAGAISGIPDGADLDTQTDVQQQGNYTSIKDSTSFAIAVKLSLAASGGGWGASVGVAASASCTSVSTATSYMILYAAFLAQSTQQVDPDQQLTPDALAALNNGTFLQEYGTHFVSGYVYGYTCNLAYNYEFSREANYAAFSAQYTESESELGFNEKVSASIDVAMSQSKTKATQSGTTYCIGFAPRPVTDMVSMAGAIEDFKVACGTTSTTPIMLIVEPWTSLNQVREVLDPNGLTSGGPLDQLAELTNGLVYIQQTASSFISNGAYSGSTQYNNVQAILTTTSAELQAISQKLANVASGKDGPLTQSDVNAFAPAAPVLSSLRQAMAQFALSLQIEGTDLTSPCFDINGNQVTGAALAAGVTLNVDWSQNDDPYVLDPQLALLVARGDQASVFYIVRDRSSGELWMLAQATDSDGAQTSPTLLARGSMSPNPVKWVFSTDSSNTTISVSVA
jgi:hypothetical protein